MEDIKEIFNERPSERLWERLDERLEVKAGLRKLRFYRIAAFAAMVTALIASVAYFNHILDDHNPHLFASNEDFSSFVLEELENENEGLFNMAFFSDIREAYVERKNEENELDLTGSYKATNGEIGLSIDISDYVYSLEFDYEGFPKLILKSVEGQTLYFVSDKGDQLKMNIEPYGLRLLDSSFLPEYKNFRFDKLTSI